LLEMTTAIAERFPPFAVNYDNKVAEGEEEPML
jgi:hypothetical protein